MKKKWSTTHETVVRRLDRWGLPVMGVLILLGGTILLIQAFLRLAELLKIGQ